MQHLDRLTPPQPAPAHRGLDRRPCARGEVLGVPLHDELILHDGRTGHTYVLNATGARLWSLCNGSQPVAVLAGLVADAYGLSHEQAVADVQDLIDELERADLLDWR